MSTLSERIKFYTGAYMRVKMEDLLNMDDLNVTKKIILKCIKKAYQDLKRKVPYLYSISQRKDVEEGIWENFCNLKKSFIQEVDNIIYDNLVDEKGLLLCNNIEPSEIIEKICELNEKYSNLFRLGQCITVGIAQKWVNMTLKYLWILGVYDDEYENRLEIPMDRYILEEMKVQSDLIPDKGWSEYNDIKQYKEIQEEFYYICLKEGYTRIGWENWKWLNTLV